MSSDSVALLALASALRAESGRALMELMRDLVMLRSPEGGFEPIAEIATRIGLIELMDGEIRLTNFGLKVGHALREYLFWEKQGRRMSRTEWASSLREEQFRDRDVLEIGSGFGRNLLSLQSVARSVVGVEVEPLYDPLGVLLAGVAGMQPPMVITGRAEALPRPDGSADIVLSINSIAYMQIERALAEMRRVLRPGGRAIICTSTFAGYLRGRTSEISLRRPKQIAREVMIALGTATYPVCGRLLLREFDPVCLPYTVMRNRINRAGLTMRDEETCTRGDKLELVYVAHKR